MTELSFFMRYQGDVEIALSRSLKVKYNHTIELPIYDILSLLNSNIWPILLFTRYTPSKSERPWHWPSEVTKVKNNRTIGLPTDVFLLMFSSNIWPFFGHLQQSSKPESLWLWPFKLTQDQTWWWYWTPHMWIPIDVSGWPRQWTF